MRDYLDAHNNLYIVAEYDGKIIGTLNCAPNGTRSSFQHAVTLGITVKKPYRNQGIGTALMKYVINWCENNPTVKRLELSVFHNNPRAIHVYEKLGFVTEGTKRKAFLIHGELLDIVFMAILFDQDMTRA